jgi:hypothetical protein
METIGIVLNVGTDSVEAFERGFREHELTIWQDLQARGVLMLATLSRLDISTKPSEGAVQYLVSVVFAGPEGHHLHDSDARFEAWNKLADAYQVAEPYVFGGETIVNAGP